MTINERIEMIIDSLFDGKKSAFASAINTTPSVIDNIVGKRKSKPSFDIVNKISTIEDVNIEWLITGRGEMFKQGSDTTQALVKQTESTSASHYKAGRLDQCTPEAIPLVSTQAVGGFFGPDFSIEKSDIKSYYVIPKFRNLNVDFMIELTGDSMTPQICAGDIVACSIIRNSKFIQWNKTHLLATADQGLIVKRLNQSSDPDCLLAVSNNPSYPPFDIPKDEVLGIARVVGVIHLE